MARSLEPVDPTRIPHLSGLFAPVDQELDLGDLPIVGRIPEDLRGVYLRNGPNPKFPPLGSYTYPLGAAVFTAYFPGWYRDRALKGKTPAQ